MKGLTSVFDVLVVGGGPAGSTAANLLAQTGASVLLLERERFPRFHIGESLLPCELPIFEALGIRLDGASCALRKNGAEFIDERTGERKLYPFADGLAGTPTHAYQVERAEFDRLLLDRAAAVGARVHQGEAVLDLGLEPDSVTAVTPSASYRGRYLIDATGQDALLASRKKSKMSLTGFGRAAAFAHFSELTPPARELLGDQGNIKVVTAPEGWVWVIPLSGNRVSIGLVLRAGKISSESLTAQIDRSPLLTALTSGAVASPIQVVGNFSFKNTAPYGSRWAAIGDANCFLDPVFSSGVSLAMLSAYSMAPRLSRALTEGGEDDPELMAPVEEQMTLAYRSFGSLIHGFYQRNILQNLFLAEKPDLEMRSGLISLLAGDVWRADNRFQQILLRADRWPLPWKSKIN